MSRPESIPAMRRRGSSMLSSSVMVSRNASVTLVGAAERDLRHGVAQHAGADRMPFGVVGVEEARRVMSR